MSAQTSNPPGRSAFFYGTLMAPSVLHRVCHGSTSPSNPIYATHNLKTHPALLLNHERHRVKNADYPAILRKTGSSVRGTYVTGLTDADIWRLDIFEGDEYERVKVRCRVLKAERGDGREGKASSNVHVTGNERVVLGDVVGAEQKQTGNDEGEEVEAETYVWIAGEDRLEAREWDFAEFQREKLRFWAGDGADEEYADVDEAVARQDGTGGRGANGFISSALAEEHKKDEMRRNVV